jgi:hypothetical protein
MFSYNWSDGYLDCTNTLKLATFFAVSQYNMFSHSTLYQRHIAVLGILRKCLYGHEICEDFP